MTRKQTHGAIYACGNRVFGNRRTQLPKNAMPVFGECGSAFGPDSCPDRNAEPWQCALTQEQMVYRLQRNGFTGGEFQFTGDELRRITVALVPPGVDGIDRGIGRDGEIGEGFAFCGAHFGNFLLEPVGRRLIVYPAFKRIGQILLFDVTAVIVRVFIARALVLIFNVGKDAVFR